MVGITQAHIGVLLKAQLVVQNREADAAAQSPDGHVARHQKGGGGDFVSVSVGEARPLLAIDAQHVHALAQAGKAGVDVSVGIVVVGEDGSLLRPDPCYEKKQEGNEDGGFHF